MSRRPGLGRGLDALLPPVEPEPTSAGPLEVKVRDIDPNPRQPRSRFDDEALAELSASIRAVGLLQPLVVRESAGGRYELVAGERRLRAARSAGLELVPVIVADTDERGSLERALVENIHRADLNPLEEAAAYRQLLDEGGLTQEALAARIGRSRAAIANSLRLLDLPIPVHALVAAGKLSAGHGRALLGLTGSPFQGRLAARVAQEGISVRETEDLVRRYQSMSAPPPPSTRSTVQRPPALADAQRRLSAHLSTRVRVEMGRRKGRITMDFSSTDELGRLVELILAGGPGEATVVSP